MTTNKQPLTGMAAMGAVETLRKQGYRLRRPGALCPGSGASVICDERVTCDQCGAEFVGVEKLPMHGYAPLKKVKGEWVFQTWGEYWAGVEKRWKALEKGIRHRAGKTPGELLEPVGTAEQLVSVQPMSGPVGDLEEVDDG